MQPQPKILWVDDDRDVLDSAKRLFRQTKWQLETCETADEAREKISKEPYSVIVADNRLVGANGIDLLEFARQKQPATARVLLTGTVGIKILEEAVNRAHVFRFVAKPWDNERLMIDITQAIEHHRLKVTQAGVLKEFSRQNRELERLTSGLEQIVADRTLVAESSKNEIEGKLSHVRDLVRFIKDLSHLNSIEELLNLVKKELRSFHELRPPVLGYIAGDGSPMTVFFQGKQIVERPTRQAWSTRVRMRLNEHEDRVYLANEFGRPFVKTLAVPLKKRADSDESPATLFFEHALPDARVDSFLTFIAERLQPLSIALDRILLEYHLKSTSLQWESTFDGIKDPIAIVDIDFKLVRANRHFVRPNGKTSLETACHKILTGSGAICKGCPVPSALQTKLPQKGQIKRGDRVFDVFSYPIRLSDDDTIATNLINHYVDVTNARDLHGRMIQSEKMAAVGLLAGNIAHELNNPLTGIRSLAQVLLAEIPKEQSQLLDDVKEVERAAERSQRIIENLLDFSKGETEEKRVEISLNEIVRRTLPMLKTAMREHRSEINLTEQEAVVNVEPHLMQQVVFNLVNNGCQAMKNAGTISIDTEVESVRGQSWALLKIKDTGPGIPEEILENIFEPFFTTKEKGQGTGLGLSMSQSVIERFGGKIEVETKPGEGSTFIVRLPVENPP